MNFCQIFLSSLEYASVVWNPKTRKSSEKPFTVVFRQQYVIISQEHRGADLQI